MDSTKDTATGAVAARSLGVHAFLGGDIETTGLRGCVRCALPEEAQIHQLGAMTDQERLDWLEQNPDRLEDVRGHYNNADPQITVRAAIDQMAEIQARP